MDEDDVIISIGILVLIFLSIAFGVLITSSVNDKRDALLLQKKDKIVTILIENDVDPKLSKQILEVFEQKPEKE